MTPQKFDRWVVTCSLLALLLVAIIALIGPATADARPVYVSEARMEMALSATETNVVSFDQVLCLGIGRVRGDRLPRYAKFVCTATVYPDTLIIIRTRLARSGRVVFG